jgi:hypothetical protein
MWHGMKGPSASSARPLPPPPALESGLSPSKITLGLRQGKNDASIPHQTDHSGLCCCYLGVWRYDDRD